MTRQFISLEQIAGFDNLVLAYHKAAKGKRYRRDVQAFSQNFDRNLGELGAAIRAGKMPYGRFREFIIRDPKQRIIHAACFEDRVFHHAVMNVAGDTLEKSMSPFSYACRPEKGVHKAVQQVRKNLQRFTYYSKIDIASYFVEIDHRRLMQLLIKRYKGQAFLQQLQRIIQSHQGDAGKGLPIGSLTSQYFANHYLSGLDHYLGEHPDVQAYVRYMDDVIWWCRDKETTKRSVADVRAWLREHRSLAIKPNNSIAGSKQGVTYCGYRISQGAIRLTPRKKQRFQQRRKYWEALYQQGEINALQLQKAYASVHAITAHTDSLKWRQENLRRFPALEV